MNNPKALQRAKTKRENTDKLSYEEYNIPGGYLTVWEEGNWIVRQSINTKTGITKTTRTLKERPMKPKKVEWREF